MRKADEYINLVWLVQCKTGYMTRRASSAGPWCGWWKRRNKILQLIRCISHIII